MIRQMTPADRELFITLSEEFYHSPAVLHPIPPAHYVKTFEEAIGGSPYVALYLLEKDEKIAGYGQLSFTWSTEAGGLVVWLEELYLRAAFRGQGLGSEYFDMVQKEYGGGRAARFRLEVEPENEGAVRLYRRLGYEELPYMQMLREKP